MSPLGPLGDPSFVGRTVRDKVAEMAWEGAHGELEEDAREFSTRRRLPSTLPRLSLLRWARHWLAAHVAH